MIKRINNRISQLFNEFTSSERSGGILLMICTSISLLLANSTLGEKYIALWHFEFLSIPLELIINDGLMTIFFLLIGLEIKRELFVGELSSPKKAMLPVLAALGGMLVPAMIHLFFNHGTATQNGVGIPMATDIAFSLAILALLGSRVPVSLKIFLMALAIIDDLGAILFIAFFYSTGINILYLILALGVFAGMMLLNHFKVKYISIYILLGIIMWVFMHNSGIHATITGVLVAFTIPFVATSKHNSPSHVLQHFLHKPVAYFILPLFALANTAIHIPTDWVKDLADPNSLGIILGLFVGKPAGILAFAFLGIVLGLCTLPSDLKLFNIFTVGMIAGIGFTMSIFMSLLAFSSDPYHIDGSKIAIILGSLLSAVFGYFALLYSYGGKKGKLKP